MVVLLFRNVHESQDPFTPEVMTWSLKPSTQWSTCTGFLFFMLRFFAKDIQVNLCERLLRYIIWRCLTNIMGGYSCR